MAQRKMSEDERRAQYALRNFSPAKIAQMHDEGQAKREAARKRQADNEVQAKAKESLSKIKFEIEHQRVWYNLT